MWICGIAGLDGDQQVAVAEGVHLRVDAALHADLGGAAVDGVLHLGEHVVGAVGARVVVLAMTREGAELAADEADVGEVDVAVDDVGDLGADVGGADVVGGADQRGEVGALGLRAARGRRRSSARLPARARSRIAATCGRAAAMTVSSGRASSTSSRSCFINIVGLLSRRRMRATRCAQRRIEKARTVDVLGVDRQARLQGEALGAAGVGQRRDVRPRRLGIHVVRRQRRDAAPVVDAGGEEEAVVVRAEVRRRLDVHVAAP